MEKRLLNVLKWFFISLGVLFFALIILIAALIFMANMFTIDTIPNIKPAKTNLKELQKIIDYAEDYKEQNGVYPQNIENIKENKNIKLDYSTYNNSNCYKIDFKNSKTNTTKQYQHCNIKKEGSTSTSESYSEIKE